MSTTRYFEVKVTGCKNCQKAQRKDMQSTIKVCSDSLYFEAEKIHEQNKDQLTNTCPMGAKEGEK